MVQILFVFAPSRQSNEDSEFFLTKELFPLQSV